MTCDLLYPYHNNTNDWIQWTSKRLCLYNFNALPSATACYGDSGGPLVVCEGDRIVNIGVLSYVFDREYSTFNPLEPKCRKENTVSAYVDIRHYLPWIRSKIGEGKNS